MADSGSSHQISGRSPRETMPIAGRPSEAAAATASANALPSAASTVSRAATREAVRASPGSSCSARWIGRISSAGEWRLVITASLVAAVAGRAPPSAASTPRSLAYWRATL